MKIVFFLSFFLVSCGCQNKKYTRSEEYTKETSWNDQEGLITSSKGSWKLTWE